jgi:hypothetical protein
MTPMRANIVSEACSELRKIIETLQDVILRIQLSA